MQAVPAIVQSVPETTSVFSVGQSGWHSYPHAWNGDVYKRQVIACSHLGKPEPSFEKWVKKQVEKGKDPAELTEEKWQKSLKKLTLAPVAERLSELLGKPVIFAHDVVGPDAKAKAAALKGGEIMPVSYTHLDVYKRQ